MSIEMPGQNPEKEELTKLEDLSAEQLEMYEQYMRDNPDLITPPEKRREAGPEIVEFEALISSFESNHSLEELHSVLTAEEAKDNSARETAKADLVSIFDMWNKLRKETDISKEKDDELKVEYKRLSRAVGIINSGKVDHDR